MDYSKKTVIQLKEICKKNKILGYSKLNKKDLINLVKKNIKKGGDNTNKKIKMFYEKYKNNDNYNGNYNDNLYEKLINYFNNIFNFSKPINFTKMELKKLTYFERYILYLDYYYSIFFNMPSIINNNQNTNQEYYKIIYVKNSDNHTKNFSRLYGKETSGNIKIIKLNNNLEYINNMILYFNKYTYKSHSGSCSTGIRLRINKLDNQHNTILSQNIFNDEVFCIPYNNPYIKKIIVKKNKKYKIGQKYKINNNNK